MAATALGPEMWPWTAGAVVTDQALLTLAGLWTRCGLLGPNLKRLPLAAAARKEIAITIDDGPARSHPPSSTSSTGMVRKPPSSASASGRRTTPICAEKSSRTATPWKTIACITAATSHCSDSAAFRAAAQETLAAITGIRPRFFRAPAGLRNPLLDPVLSRLDLRLVSWTRRGFDTRNGDPVSVSARLLQGLNAGDVLLLHDGNAARTTSGDAVILIVLPRLLDAIAAAGLRAVNLRSAILHSADPGSAIA
jgi:hypothetical protein